MGLLVGPRLLPLPIACGEPQHTAAQPRQSMKHLIWLHWLEEMKYDLVATALQHPSPSRSTGRNDEQALAIASESHNHGKPSPAPPRHINHSKKHTMASFLMGQLSRFGVLGRRERGGWEHKRVLLKRPSVQFEYKVILFAPPHLLSSHFCTFFCLGPFKILIFPGDHDARVSAGLDPLACGS